MVVTSSSRRQGGGGRRAGRAGELGQQSGVDKDVESEPFRRRRRHAVDIEDQLAGGDLRARILGRIEARRPRHQRAARDQRADKAVGARQDTLDQRVRDRLIQKLHHGQHDRLFNHVHRAAHRDKHVGRAVGRKARAAIAPHPNPGAEGLKGRDDALRVERVGVGGRIQKARIDRHIRPERAHHRRIRRRPPVALRQVLRRRGAGHIGRVGTGMRDVGQILNRLAAARVDRHAGRHNPRIQKELLRSAENRPLVRGVERIAARAAIAQQRGRRRTRRAVDEVHRAHRRRQRRHPGRHGRILRAHHLSGRHRIAKRRRNQQLGEKAHQAVGELPVLHPGVDVAAHRADQVGVGKLARVGVIAAHLHALPGGQQAAAERRDHAVDPVDFEIRPLDVDDGRARVGDLDRRKPHVADVDRLHARARKGEGLRRNRAVMPGLVEDVDRDHLPRALREDRRQRVRNREALDRRAEHSGLPRRQRVRIRTRNQHRLLQIGNRPLLRERPGHGAGQAARNRIARGAAERRVPDRRRRAGNRRRAQRHQRPRHAAVSRAAADRGRPAGRRRARGPRHHAALRVAARVQHEAADGVGMGRLPARQRDRGRRLDIAIGVDTLLAGRRANRDQRPDHRAVGGGRSERPAPGGRRDAGCAGGRHLLGVAVAVDDQIADRLDRRRRPLGRGLHQPRRIPQRQSPGTANSGAEPTRPITAELTTFIGTGPRLNSKTSTPWRKFAGISLFHRPGRSRLPSRAAPASLSVACLFHLEPVDRRHRQAQGHVALAIHPQQIAVIDHAVVKIAQRPRAAVTQMQFEHIVLCRLHQLPPLVETTSTS